MITMLFVVCHVMDKRTWETLQGVALLQEREIAPLPLTGKMGKFEEKGKKMKEQGKLWSQN